MKQAKTAVEKAVKITKESAQTAVEKVVNTTKESAKTAGEKISNAVYNVADICSGNDAKAFAVGAVAKTAAWFAGAATIAGAVSLGEKLVYGKSLGGKTKAILTYAPLAAGILTASSAAEALIKNKKCKGVWHFPKVVDDKVITTDLETESKSE